MFILFKLIEWYDRFISSHDKAAQELDALRRGYRSKKRVAVKRKQKGASNDSNNP